MRRQIRRHIDLAAIGGIDDQPPGMQVQLAADAPGQECFLAAIFGIADKRMADRGSMNADLVGAPGQRRKLHPGGARAGLVDDAVTGLRFQPGFGVDVHLFAATARLLRQRRVDLADGDLGHIDGQAPIGLFRIAAGKGFRKKRRRPRRTGKQQHPRRVLVEPVHQLGPGRHLILQRVEQAIDMGGDANTALRRQPRRLVDDDGVLVHVDDQPAHIIDLCLAERLAFARHRARRGGCRQHIGPHQRLAGGNPVPRRRLGTIKPDRAGTRPARHDVEAGIGHMALEPAIEPYAIVVVGDDLCRHQLRPK